MTLNETIYLLSGVKQVESVKLKEYKGIKEQTCECHTHQV